jgi:hypothetical protein
MGNILFVMLDGQWKNGGKNQHYMVKCAAKFMPKIPENIKGCTEKPLFDSIPVKIFIVCMFHASISVSNTLFDRFSVWAEERTESLTADEIMVRNVVIYAEVRCGQSKEDFEMWLKNDRVLLGDLQMHKRASSNPRY